MYRCPMVTVAPRNEKQCYRELPVFFQPPHANHSIPMFLEPYTRRLSQVGAVVPCNEKFLPKFRTLTGQWIMAHPAILAAQTPEDDEALLVTPRNISLPEQDFTKGGVYPEDVLNRMRNYISFSNVRDALIFKLAQQTPMQTYANMVITPGDLFPKFDVWAWIKSQLWTFLTVWGSIASIFMSIVTIFGVVSWAFHTLLNCFTLHSVHGCDKTLIWSFCLNAFMARQYGHKNRRKTNDDAETLHRPDDEDGAGGNIYVREPFHDSSDSTEARPKPIIRTPSSSFAQITKPRISNPLQGASPISSTPQDSSNHDSSTPSTELLSHNTSSGLSFRDAYDHDEYSGFLGRYSLRRGFSPLRWSQSLLRKRKAEAFDDSHDSSLPPPPPPLAGSYPPTRDKHSYMPMTPAKAHSSPPVVTFTGPSTMSSSIPDQRMVTNETHNSRVQDPYNPAVIGLDQMKVLHTQHHDADANKGEKEKGGNQGRFPISKPDGTYDP